jgi:CzcA family heavy metal efflux pump
MPDSNLSDTGQSPEQQHLEARTSALGRFSTHHAIAIAFIVFALCLGGMYSATKIPSSVFPQTNFPRVVILIDNGVMPGDEMMATITRPIEEAMKDIPGVVTIRDATGRGSAEVNVFFNWKVDMIQSELYVLSRLSQIRSTLPATATTNVFRLTFSAFPIIGVSLTSTTRDITHLWEIARYTLKPRFLRIPGVGRVDLVGGRKPEYHVIVDPLRMEAAGLSFSDVTEALLKRNLIAPAGMHEENHTLYLTVVDGRLHGPKDIEELIVRVDRDPISQKNSEMGTHKDHPIRIRDFARVQRGPEPVFNVVTADGKDAVLLNIRSQPDGSTLNIARQLKQEINRLKEQLPPDLKLAFFYDQSLIVRESVKSVWEAIIFGLFLSVAVLYLFLKDWGMTIVATLVIPATVLITLIALKVMGLSFNLMTLGGIAAAIGVIIDNAIIVVEAIYVKIVTGAPRWMVVQEGVAEIFKPLLSSTFTPVVVFIPLAFLDGIVGVFFRSLALTMAVSLLISLLLAITITPSMAAWFMGGMYRKEKRKQDEQGGIVLRSLTRAYECTVRVALAHPWITLWLCVLILFAGIGIYNRLQSEFLPPMDEGAFVIDYMARPGTSLAETDRQLKQAEQILRTIPELESYSRRTGARLALAIAEPHTGDFLVKLKPNHKRKTAEVIAELRHKFNAAVPGLLWEFPGILSDLIGDLMWAPEPIEVKLYSTDTEFLKKMAPQIEQTIQKVRGVVDTFDGLMITGPSLSLQLRGVNARRFGLTTDDVASAVKTAMFGQTASSVLEGDRLVDIRVIADPCDIDRVASLQNLPLRCPTGAVVKLSQVANVVEEPGQLELRREDLRQDVAVTARLEGRDLGSAMAEIRSLLAQDTSIPMEAIEFGGLYQQQQESFRHLLVVLAMAITLVFTVLLTEFRTFAAPIAIVFGSVLAMFGAVIGLYITGTSLNVVSLLGGTIGIGIVAKNGILMLDFASELRGSGLDLANALVRAGQRRLRPVLMTSATTALGMLPLAYGVGSGADMLRPLAIAVIGAVCISVLLSLVATPTFYSILFKIRAFRSQAK